MEQTYKYFQPKYVSEFKCDSTHCKAFCCRRWQINIDNKTYKKYSNIKPKSAAHNIIKYITKGKENNYHMILDEHNCCPMLTEDNLCSIQKTYGEEFLCETCVTYPRRTYKFKNFYERSLVLTCPNVATRVLLQPEPMAFEQIEVPKIIHDNLGRIKPQFTNVPVELWNDIIDIQKTAIFILQERSMPIDRRLIVLGFFLDKLSEVIGQRRLSGIKQLTEIYQSKEFLKEKAPNFAQSINFNVNEFIKVIFGTFETLYNGKNNFKARDIYLFKTVTEIFKIRVDENNQIKVKDLAKSYTELNGFRASFVNQFSTVFENYLVNEFFLNVYPWKFRQSVTYNYSVFLTIYKLLELLTMTSAIVNLKFPFQEKLPISKVDLVSTIILVANNVDHNNQYLNRISQYLKGKEDIVGIMESLLQG